MSGDLLTLEQVAKRLQVSKRTVQRAIDRRGLRAVQVAGRNTWRVRGEDLEAWLDQRATDRPAPPLGQAAGVALAVARPRPQRAGTGRLGVTPDMGRTA